MSFYSAPFTFRFDLWRIDVDAGVTDVDILVLYDAIKAAQASEEGIIYERIAAGSGLNILGPAVQVGLTVELLGSWQLRFPAGNYTARIAGGNLIATGGGSAVAYTAGVQTVLIQSAASTVVTVDGTTAGDVVDALMAEEIAPGLDVRRKLRNDAAMVAGSIQVNGDVQRILEPGGTEVLLEATVNSAGRTPTIWRD